MNSYARSYLAITLVVVCLFTFGRYSLVGAQGAGVSCHTATAYDPSKGYGAPVSFFSGAGTTTMRAVCRDDAMVSIHLGIPNGSVFVYKYAYHLTAENKRERIALTGSHPYGAWFLGSADGVVSHPRESSKFYAYMCEYVAGAWRCGCSDSTCAKANWQVQTYTFPREDDVSAECPLPRVTRVEPKVLAYNKPFRVIGEHFETGTATVLTMYTKDKNVSSNKSGTEVKLSYKPAFMRATLANTPSPTTYTDEMLAMMRDYSDKPDIESATIVEQRVTKSPNWIIITTPCGSSEPFWLESELPSAISG